jgi:hypothetical protein
MGSSVIVTSLLVLSWTLRAPVPAPEGEVIFFDDFNTRASYESTLTRNATNKEYTNNSLREGHRLTKWNYSWDYSYEGSWRQAFYVVPEGKTYMEQAGRSAKDQDNRITARALIPDTAVGYVVELRQYKNDNDPLYYLIGCDPNGHHGIEFGYENQIPTTDKTVKDMYLRGTFGDGVFIEGMAKHRQWTDVTIEVDVPRKFVTWRMDGTIVSRGYVADLRPGGCFGIWMSYERGTRFDDVKITVYDKSR